MRKIMFYVIFILSFVFINGSCEQKGKERNGGSELGHQLPNTDSLSFMKGKSLYTQYCLSCHNLSKKLPLIGLTKDTSLERFTKYVLKNSSDDTKDIKIQKHFKFDTLSKKDVTDIKYYLDHS